MRTAAKSSPHRHDLDACKRLVCRRGICGHAQGDIVARFLQRVKPPDLLSTPFLLALAVVEAHQIAGRAIDGDYQIWGL